MVRIVIETEGEGVPATSVEAQDEGAAPAELLRTAAAVGAMNAGRAPTAPGAETTAENLPSGERDTMAAAPLDAGAAPHQPTEDVP